MVFLTAVAFFLAACVAFAVAVRLVLGMIPAPYAVDDETNSSGNSPNAMINTQ
jgi:hypothetical protein